MLFQNLLLIIRQLRSPHNSRRANLLEKILKYRQHEGLSHYIEQDILAICPLLISSC